MKQNDVDLTRDDVRTVLVEPMLNEDEDEIDLVELMLSVLRDWKILVIAAVLCAIIGVAAAKLLPKTAASSSYTASTTVYLAKQDVVSNIEADNAVDLLIAYMMNSTRQGYAPAQDFMSLVKDTAVLQRVIDDLDLNTDTGALAANIETPLEKYTRMVRVELKDGDPDRARTILERLCEVSADSLKELMVDEPLTVTWTDVALEEQSSGGSGRSAKKYALLGGTAGFVLVALLSAVTMIFDKRLRSGRDVDRYLRLPIMAVVKDGKAR